jgi:arylsulfatase A-like enzyme
VPKKYFDQYPLSSVALPKVFADDLSDVPSQGRQFANPGGVHADILRLGLWQDRVRAYMAAVSAADAQVGRLHDALDKSPYRDNTIIVFVGDNGWHLGQKEHWAKVTLWNEATRVPMIWVAPKLAKAGSKCEHGVDLMSVYPTLCELAGVPVPKHAEGVNIKPMLADPAAEWDTPGLSTMLKGNHTLVTAQWRYIRYNDGTEELYDHRVDPLERTNLAGKPEYADVKAKLAKHLPTKNAEPVAEQPPPPRNRRPGQGQRARG